MQNKDVANREVSDELLRGILAVSIKKMETNPICRKILENSNYQEFKKSPRRPVKFDENHFYLEKIYVGHGSNGPSGHCTKEIYDAEMQKKIP